MNPTTPPTPSTLLLVYIHGFKGDHTTFSTFPSHLSALLSHRLPAHHSIRHLIFPTFETRGDLDATVQKFRSWLEEKVIDIEVELGTESPTVRPGVGVLVVGHSMGGIVGVEAVLGIAGERVIRGGKVGDGDKGDEGLSGEAAARGAEGAEEEEKEEEEGVNDQERNGDGDEADGHWGWKTAKNEDMNGQSEEEPTTLLFPYIIGMLAFDTPYLGISPGVVAHGAEGHWREGKAWYDTAMGLWGGMAGASAFRGSSQQQAQQGSDRALPPASGGNDNGETKNQNGEQKPSTWQGRWGKTALIASAGFAATAGLGATAYLKRETITSSISWVSSHLEFVGCLARGAELRQRLEKMQRISRDRNIGFRNKYTLLAEDKGGPPGGRTFCNLPKQNSGLAACFEPSLNPKAGDELSAHVGMFVPKENPGYYTMSEEVLELIVDWVKKDDLIEA